MSDSASKSKSTKKSESKAKTESKSKTESKPKTEAKKSSTSTPAKSSGGTVQNGKGSSPRNMGPDFLKNYNGIKWSEETKSEPGKKFVKVYK